MHVSHGRDRLHYQSRYQQWAVYSMYMRGFQPLSCATCIDRRRGWHILSVSAPDCDLCGLRMLLCSWCIETVGQLVHLKFLMLDLWDYILLAARRMKARSGEKEWGRRPQPFKGKNDSVHGPYSIRVRVKFRSPVNREGNGIIKVYRPKILYCYVHCQPRDTSRYFLADRTNSVKMVFPYLYRYWMVTVMRIYCQLDRLFAWKTTPPIKRLQS